MANLNRTKAGHNVLASCYGCTIVKYGLISRHIRSRGYQNKSTGNALPFLHLHCPQVSLTLDDPEVRGFK